MSSPPFPPVDAPEEAETEEKKADEAATEAEAKPTEESKVEEIADEEAEEKKEDGEAAEKPAAEEAKADAETDEAAAPEADAEAEAKPAEEAEEEKKEEAATEEKEEETAAAEAEAEDGEKPSADAAEAAEEAEAKVEEEKEVDPLDMLDDDALLDDALNEVHGSPAATATATEEKKADGEAATKAEEAEPKKEEKKLSAEEEEAEKEKAMEKAQIQAELHGIKMESEAITEKLEEMLKELSEATPGSDQHDTLTLHVKIASRMLELVRETRALRSEKATIKKFIEVQMADINKARVNIGETDPYETEEFQDDSEKELSGIQLFRAALQYLNHDPAVAVHLLRLAAIHHHHAPSVVALMSIYTNVPSSYPRGASLLLNNAIRGEGHDVEARTNSRVGDLFNSGTRHFPPVFSLAVYFHQRAAVAGNTHSMTALAQLFLAGECSGDDTMSPSLKRLNTDEKRANYFLQCAVDRGSIVAYLIRAAQFAKGAEGMPQSLDSAEKYYKKAIAAESSLSSPQSAQMRIGSRMTLGELAALFAPKTEAAPKATTTTVSEVKKAGPTTSVKPADDDDDIIELRPSAPARPSGLTASGARMGYQAGGPSGAVSAPAKRNTGMAASNNKRKSNWERAARWGITTYALYVVAFPVRLIMLPFFYEVAANVLDFLGISSSGANSLEAAGF